MKSRFSSILFGLFVAVMILAATSLVWSKNTEIKEKQEDPVFKIRTNINTNTAPDAETLGDKAEVIDKRGLNSSTFASVDDLKNNQYTTQFSSAPTHYIDSDSGWWRNIDTNWQIDSDGSFFDKKNNYNSYTPKNSTDMNIIFDNVFENPDVPTASANKHLTKTNRNRHSVSFKPISMQWVNDAGEEEKISDLLSVDGTKNNNTVTYKNVFGAGNDIEIINLPDSLKKNIVLNNSLAKETTFSNHDSSQYLDITFELNLFNTKRVKVKDDKTNQTKNLANINDNDPISTKDTIIIKDQNAKDNDDITDLQSRIKPAVACDSKDKCINIELKLTKVNDKYYLTKHIPKSFLDSANYPVRTDTTTTYTADSGGDGCAYYGENDPVCPNYEAIRNATSGNVDSSGGIETVGQDYVNFVMPETYIYRFFSPFNTADLPDDAVISGANYKFVVYTDSSDTDFDATIVQTTQASGSALVGEDYDTQGAVSGGSVNTAGIAVGSYTTIAMNATGYGWISKTGYTKLGLRSSNDINDIPPFDSYPMCMGMGSMEYLNVYSSDTPGSEPKLEVTYTLPGTFMTGNKYW